MKNDIRKEKLLEELRRIEEEEKKEKDETIESDLTDTYENKKKFKKIGRRK